MEKKSTPSAPKTKRRYKKSRKGIGGRKPKRSAVDEKLLMAEACHHFIKGKSVTEMKEALEKKWPQLGTLSRERPYDLVRKAGREGYLRYDPPPHEALQDRLREDHDWLRTRVIHTTIAADVAHRTAEALLEMVKRVKDEEGEDVVHVGFASGFSLRQVAKAFGELLSKPSDRLPSEIVFHAMVMGHDLADSSTDSNAFFAYFTNRPVLQVRARFMGLHAPAIVDRSEYELLRDKNAEVRRSMAAADQLHIIVTSGTDWDDEHSALKDCMKSDQASLDRLIKAGTVGDILWRPIAEGRPPRDPEGIRAMTLLELEELPMMIEKGTKILLMLGPCGKCGRTKGRLLKTVLEQRERLISHLVVDSRTTGEYYELREREQDA
jgi:DNA-binding transcriptional regulator LsrR (DeoR family)